MGHDLQEAAGARRALVVHHEVQHLARGADGDALGVLATDVDDRAHVGAQPVRAPPVTGDLGHCAVGVGHLHPAVARGHQCSDLLPGQPRLLQRTGQHEVGGRGAIVARGQHRRGQQLVAAQNGRLGRDGPYVHTRNVHCYPPGTATGSAGLQPGACAFMAPSPRPGGDSAYVWHTRPTKKHALCHVPARNGVTKQPPP